MKCVCVKLREKQRDDPWLTLGREYDVLSILVEPGRLSVLRILADDGRTPILVESAAFEMASQEIPSNWFCVISEGGVIEIGPEAWLQDGFWERYFDGDADAVEKFWREVRMELWRSEILALPGVARLPTWASVLCGPLFNSSSVSGAPVKTG